MILTATINEVKRRITFDNPNAVVAVKGDYEVNGVAFAFPAIYEDDFDLSTAVKTVYYKATDGIIYNHVVTDTDTDTGYPLWVFKDEINKGAFGDVEFALVCDKVEGGNIVKRWVSMITTFRVQKSIEIDESEQEDNEQTYSERLAYLMTQMANMQVTVNGLASGAPTAVSLASAMTDTSKLYVYTGSESGYTAGHWYYYNGSAWTDGGQYGGTSVDPTLTVSGAAADAKVTGDKIAEIKEDLSALDSSLFTQSVSFPRLTGNTFWTFGSEIVATTGANAGNNKACRTAYVTLSEPTTIEIDNDEYILCVWVYGGQSVSSAIYSPTKAYVGGKVLMIPKSETSYFRIGVKRVDGAVLTNDYSDTTSDAYKIITAVKTYTMPASIREYNSYSLLPHLSNRTIASDGLTGSVVDDTITVSGTTTGSFFIDYYSNTAELPNWWIPGRDVSLIFNANGEAISDMYLRIIYYDAGGTAHDFGSYKSTQVINIPASFDGVGLIVRFYVPTGRTVNGSVRPQLLNAMSNEELTKLINQGDSFENPPMLTIIDDDGNTKFYTDLLPLVTSKGVSITSAVIPERANGNVETHMTWEQIVDASKNGAEIVSHTFNHLTGDLVQNMTEQEIWLNYQKANNTIAAHGLPGHDFLVYAGASGSYATAQSAANHSSKCAFKAGGNALNYKGQFNRYYINRYRVQTDGYEYNPDALKQLIDYCLANGGWMVWMIHTSETVWTTQNGLAGITAAIDYAIEQGLPVVSVATGYKYYIE